MSKRTPKNRSARQKRLSRQRTGRQARHPLRALQPPFRPYEEWISVPAGAEQLPDGVLDEDLRAFHTMVAELAPLYAGCVPLAAVYLEQHIRQGVLPIVDPTRPDMASLVPVDEFAAACTVAGDLPGDQVGPTLHELHFHGALVVDDDHVIRLAELV